MVFTGGGPVRDKRHKTAVDKIPTCCGVALSGRGERSAYQAASLRPLRRTTTRYDLTTRTGLSQSKRLQQLLNAEQMGDRTPSLKLLLCMKQLLGDNASLMDDKLLTQLFIQRLPTAYHPQSNGMVGRLHRFNW